MAPLNFFSHTNSFQTAFSNNITFVRTCPSLFKQFCTLKCTYKYFFCCRNENGAKKNGDNKTQTNLNKVQSNNEAMREEAKERYKKWKENKKAKK